jgi:hypothetical protein
MIKFIVSKRNQPAGKGRSFGFIQLYPTMMKSCMLEFEINNQPHTLTKPLHEHGSVVRACGMIKKWKSVFTGTPNW